MKKHLAIGLLLSFIALTVSTAHADTEVTYVGQNPFPCCQPTGGTGTIEGQQAGSATLVKTFTSLGDIPFIVDGGPTATSGMDVFRINERVSNDTGVDWTDFHMVVEPIDANPNMVVNFENITNPTGEFNSIMPMPNSLWLVGSVPNGSTFSISYDLKISSPPGAFYLFGVHETPSVPEPATLSLLGCALAGLAFYRRARVC